MTIGWQRPRSRNSGSWNSVGWTKQKHQAHPQEAHVTEAEVGPKGSGKSLLAVYRTHQFAQGKVRQPDGSCLCAGTPNADPNCNGKWTVFTNLESPTLPEYGAWAHPLDLASQMIDMESEARHVYFYIDEAPQYFDARRSMLTEVIKLSKQATMFRKKLMRMNMTAISFDWLDRRIRDQTNIIYNCWTENRGVTVNAIVYRLATGNIAPWMRDKIPPEMKWWATAHARKLYDSNELVNADADIQALRAEPQALIRDPITGQLTSITMSEILSKVILELANEGYSSVDPVELVEKIQERYALPTSKGFLRDWLIDAGFVKDGRGNFIIVAGAA